MTQRRYLHVFGTFDLGGAEARTLDLMAALGPGIEHVVLVGDLAAMSARAMLPAGVRAVFPQDAARLVSGRPTPARLAALAGVMRGHDLVLTYAWGAMDMAMAHTLHRRQRGLPPLVHHEDGIDPPLGLAGRLLRAGYRRLALRGAARVVVPSRTLAQVARREWGVPGARLAHIANGVALPSPPRAPVLPIPGVQRQPGETLVCTVAGLRPVKNLPRLVRAVAAAGSDLRLAVMGEGPERGAILAEAARLGCAGRVDLAGFVPQPQRHLGNAEIFALSSDSEQCPLALLEAMALGLPVVATRVGDIADMVSAENLPFLVEPADEAGFARALRRLADDAGLRAAVGAANAARAAREHDAAAMVARYRALYEGLAGGSD